jgi:hypothetical protein
VSSRAYIDYIVTKLVEATRVSIRILDLSNRVIWQECYSVSFQFNSIGLPDKQVSKRSNQRLSPPSVWLSSVLKTQGRLEASSQRVQKVWTLVSQGINLLPTEALDPLVPLAAASLCVFHSQEQVVCQGSTE